MIVCWAECEAKVDSKAIEKVLSDWGFTALELAKLNIIFDIRDMIPEACVSAELAAGYCFIIYLRRNIFRDQQEANKAVAHELRHIWYMMKIRRGNSKRVRWEEHNCRRIEGKYKDVNFVSLK